MREVNVEGELVAEALAGESTGAGSTAWAPLEACTLPSAEQPLRVAEFGQLFAASVRGVARLSVSRLRLELDATAEPAARDLAARESSCCTFFTFTFAPAGEGTVWMDIEVPPERADVLDGLAAQASGRREE